MSGPILSVRNLETYYGPITAIRGVSFDVSEGQIVTILTANKDVFHAEKDAILEAGLATAAWVTVDDTGARHAGANEYTTHIGNDRFAWPGRRRAG